jgi:hypothetical protein
MKPVLIGSGAARLWFPDFRPSKDLDYFTDQEMPKEKGGKRVESFYHPGLEKWYWENTATPSELYTIKVSHLAWSNNWVKHAKDAIFFQKKDVALDENLYAILYPIWEEHYGRKRARLPKGTKAEDFFTKQVERKYEHDSIHASVAYYDAPLFNAVLQDGEDVAVSWGKFEALSETDKLRLVREEVYATALERLVIPSDYQYSSTAAYRWALQQTITSFWKGRWSKWAILNLQHLVTPEIDYVQKHKDNDRKLVLL